MAAHTPARRTGFDVSGTHRALARRLRTSAAAAARVQRGPRFPAPLAPATGTVSDAQEDPMCRALARTVRSSLDAAFPDSPKLSSSCASCSTLPWPAT